MVFDFLGIYAFQTVSNYLIYLKYEIGKIIERLENKIYKI